jgi:hypothetical protein
MLYYDKEKDISVFATGKHGTRTLHSVVEDYYKDKEFSLLDGWKKNVDANSPLYAGMTDRYLAGREKSEIKTSMNYVIIRNPRDRFLSGLITNMKIIMQENGPPFESVIYDDSIFDRSFVNNDFHIGSYLIWMLYPAIRDHTIFVELNQVSHLWKSVFDLEDVPNRNKSTDLALLGHTADLDINILNKARLYYAKIIDEGTSYPDFMNIYRNEVDAYNYILNNCEIYKP